jgi:hypothetical protein
MAIWVFFLFSAVLMNSSSIGKPIKPFGIIMNLSMLFSLIK